MPHPDKVFDALLLLLRAGLWGQLPSQELRAAESGRPTLFPLTADEWALLYREACEQTVVGIVWQGVSQLPQELMPPHATTMRWVAHVDAIERLVAIAGGLLLIIPGIVTDLAGIILVGGSVILCGKYMGQNQQEKMQKLMKCQQQ